MTGPGARRDLDEYVEAEAQRLLAEDPHITEQGVTVLRREHALVLRGEVESARRREQIVRLLEEHFPGIALRVDIATTRTQPPDAAEELT